MFLRQMWRRNADFASMGVQPNIEIKETSYNLCLCQSKIIYIIEQFNSFNIQLIAEKI